MRAVRTITTGLATALAAGLLAALPAGAAHASPFLAEVVPLNLTWPTAMVDAGGTLVVTDTDSVVLLHEDGSAIATISDLPGASNPVVSGDGSTVYVALTSANEIVAVDVATHAAAATYQVGECPGSLAVVGTSLFYAYRCNAGNLVGRVDLSTGSVDDPATPVQELTATATLAGGTSTLFAHLQYGPVKAWTVGGGGALSSARTTPTSYIGDRISAHGDRVIIETYGAGVGWLLLDADLNVVPAPAFSGHLDMGSSEVPAWAPDGSRIALGSRSNDATLGVYDMATGALVVAPYALAPKGGGNDVDILERGLSFSADGTHVLGLAQDMFAPGFALVRSIATTPSTTTLLASVKGPARLGLPVTVTVATPGRPGTRVKVVFSPIAGHGATLSAVTDASGIARFSYLTTWTGELKVFAAGDSTHYPAETSYRRWYVPSRMTVITAKGYKTRSGVQYYHKATDARFVVGLAPGVSGRKILATLMIRVNGKWSRVQYLWVTTKSNGVVGFYLVSARKGYAYRITFLFKGDIWNLRSSGASAVFVVG
ncbi:MAG: hypothetical protein U0R68_04150 [Candidatus Nanopelagicales bacterium]